MISCFDNGNLVNKDLFVKVQRARLRVISMASNKIESLKNYIKEIKRDNHFIVYCSDGKVIENDISDDDKPR